MQLNNSTTKNYFEYLIIFQSKHLILLLKLFVVQWRANYSHLLKGKQYYTFIYVYNLSFSRDSKMKVGIFRVV